MLFEETKNFTFIGVYKPGQSLTLPVLLLLIPAFQPLESLNVLNRFKCFVEIIHNVSNQGLDVLLVRKDREKLARKMQNIIISM